jgi:hypothetical protein
MGLLRTRNIIINGQAKLCNAKKDIFDIRFHRRLYFRQHGL